MSVDIDDLTITTPVARSSTNPVALELSGAQALSRFPDVVRMLDDGSVQFTAPTRGASSKSTRRTRCEWSESVDWKLSSAANHVNRQTLRLDKVNSARKVVIAQMHVRGDDGPPVKVFWNKGSITLGFRPRYDQTTPSNSTILEGVPLGTVFSLEIHVSSKGLVTVSATCNGASGSSTPLQLDDSWNSHLFEFHGGIYNQIDYNDATPASDGSVCVIRELGLRHE
ncbi:polysaccharide lyase family 7 protein [Pseudomonas sp. S75]|uniref:polysaccharide lyase family 7 protein n=1 Tax=unclassified Pseudomonas TaxID=196821 RepID=UPI001902CA9D|nr:MULTISPECIES: polysaccharide lyase family 7 protein [unclassified Pseudomonas]MBJ9973911.1 polysaccharide lyase family 7 protein [Pseudomonas sp. S30]MBK0152159.1 polysaccharide lyase family 7 protein [Pseudomonas sp. S75]